MRSTLAAPWAWAEAAIGAQAAVRITDATATRSPWERPRPIDRAARANGAQGAAIDAIVLISTIPPR
jgi:hypothetical protein